MKSPKNKMVSSKDIKSKEAPLKKFFVPRLGIVVEAKNTREALEQLNSNNND